MQGVVTSGRINEIQKQLFLCVLFILLSNFLKAQLYPQNYFRSPMDTPLFLSATFGTLRDNHFHSGMDIRTGEKTGLPVYAVADGYVSRIKYASSAYGKAIYISHPNGYTSVYAHLQNANGHIASYIKRYQYEKEVFEFDHFPAPGLLKVKQGDTIGWSGNTGTSTGPHLHFEMRNSNTEEIINPQHFGIYGVDLFPPIIKQLSIYSLESNRPNLLHDFALSNQKLLSTDSGFVLADTIRLASTLLGFAVDAKDFLTDNKKEFNVHGIELFVDNKKYFRFSLDQFTFDATRCVNTHIDFKRYKTDDIRIQKLFWDDGNKIRNYPYMRNKGRVGVADTLIHCAKITAFDFTKKSYTIYLYFKSLSSDIHSSVKPANTVSTFYPQMDNNFLASDVQVFASKGVLYDTLDLVLQTSTPSIFMQSKLYKFSENFAPLHRNIKVSIKFSGEKYQDKMVLCAMNKGSGFRYVGGDYENGWVHSHINSFGDFFVGVDSIPPKIALLNGNSDLISDTTSIKLNITDDLSGIATYRGSINGKWELFEYDAKNGLLEYFFDENSPKGKLDLEIFVSDRKSNSTNFKTTFIRK